FDTWLDDLQLYLLSDSRDNVSLFDHTSGAAPAPPATADSATRSQLTVRPAHSLQSFTFPDSPQPNGIAKRRIGLVMEVARTSMIHAAAPHFLWPFAVQYAAHQLNL
ncbi:unnamed protein product, partial [Closterium sp. NIES-54]